MEIQKFSRIISAISQCPPFIQLTPVDDEHHTPVGSEQDTSDESGQLTPDSSDESEQHSSDESVQFTPDESEQHSSDESEQLFTPDESEQHTSDESEQLFTPAESEQELGSVQSRPASPTAHKSQQNDDGISPSALGRPSADAHPSSTDRTDDFWPLAERPKSPPPLPPRPVQPETTTYKCRHEDCKGTFSSLAARELHEKDCAFDRQQLYYTCLIGVCTEGCLTPCSLPIHHATLRTTNEVLMKNHMREVHSWAFARRESLRYVWKWPVTPTAAAEGGWDCRLCGKFMNKWAWTTPRCDFQRHTVECDGIGIGSPSKMKANSE
ncbi:hypothetical protein BDV95DRAFT_618871 [Massariosphaeria phaeospora]|uniref:Uncharacterized protein n=1 Tax=Massariosphaeria phaeospora TaxID=100035 RepID=A0A7C8MNU3_9PLEO|nr:hypothetical protein BDV95DRAFT_618871 [Massariosphaeria phaeospora]